MDKVTNEIAIDRDLVDEAASLNVSLPDALETALRSKLTDEKARRWVAENAQAIASNNRARDAVGLWSDRLRLF